MKARRFDEWPLVFFTLLSQLSVGLFLVWGLGAVFLADPAALRGAQFSRVVMITALAALILGGGSAAAHLGRVSNGIFSLSNWRRSWLSREALLAGGFGLVVSAAVLITNLLPDFDGLVRVVILLGCLQGTVFVWGISKLYQLRTVPAWNHLGTPASFFITTLLSGWAVLMILWYAPNGAYAADSSGAAAEAWAGISSSLVSGLVGLQAAVFFATVIHLNRQGGAGADSARLLGSRLRWVVVLRWIAAGTGLGYVFWSHSQPSLLAGYGLLIGSEILGRYLFYAFYRRSGL